MSELLLIGATGLVGAKVAALAPRAALTIVARRALDSADGMAVIVAPSERWVDLIAEARPDIFLNCLGTTIRQAGSQAAFRAVDHDLVLAAAGAARASGARHCISVSSVGANAAAGNDVNIPMRQDQGQRPTNQAGRSGEQDRHGSFPSKHC